MSALIKLIRLICIKCFKQNHILHNLLLFSLVYAQGLSQIYNQKSHLNNGAQKRQVYLFQSDN